MPKSLVKSSWSSSPSRMGIFLRTMASVVNMCLSYDYFSIRNFKIDRIDSRISCGYNCPIFGYDDRSDFSFYKLYLSYVFNSFHIFIVSIIWLENPYLVSENKIEIIQIGCIEKTRCLTIIKSIIFWEIIDSNGAFVIVWQTKDFIQGEVLFEDIKSSIDPKGENTRIFNICRLKYFCF